MKMLTVFALALLSCLTATAQVRPIQKDKQCRELAELFIQQISRRQYDAAFRLIESHAVIPADELAKMKDTIAQQHEGIIRQRYGAIIGFERVDDVEVKDVAVKYVFVMKYERHFITWRFIFYKPRKDEYVLAMLDYNDNLNRVFEEKD